MWRNCPTLEPGLGLRLICKCLVVFVFCLNGRYPLASCGFTTRRGIRRARVTSRSGCAGSILVDRVRDSTPGSADRGGPSFLRTGTGGCVLTMGDHIPPRESLFQDIGKEDSANSRTSDSGGTMQVSSQSQNSGPAPHSPLGPHGSSRPSLFFSLQATTLLKGEERQDTK